MIEAVALTKRYGPVVAVDDLTFTVKPGELAGFLGPNGAGKSTTLRMLLGLDAPTAGRALVCGHPVVDHRRPLTVVGGLLEATAAHPGRTAYHHLLCLALSNGIRRARVREVLELVGLGRVADRRVGSFSLGMSQRLGIAAALLGDPPVLLLDEPVNGLDAEGVHWVRNLLKQLASEGRAVLLSSHLLSEVAITANRLIIIGRGRLLADTTVEELLAGGKRFVRVRSARAPELAHALEARGASLAQPEPELLHVEGVSVDAVGELATANGWALQELSQQQPSLEEIYLALTGAAVDYRAGEEPAAEAS
jgi:ABC-2 type transport system ATP-binding protein